MNKEVWRIKALLVIDPDFGAHLDQWGLPQLVSNLTYLQTLSKQATAIAATAHARPPVDPRPTLTTHVKRPPADSSRPAKAVKPSAPAATVDLNDDGSSESESEAA